MFFYFYIFLHIIFISSHLYMLILISYKSIYFLVFKVHCDNKKRIQFNEFKWYEVNMFSFTFCFTSFYLQCHVFSELLLATTVTMLKSVPCYYLTSFDYAGKKARDICLTCKCHQRDIMPDSIFCDSMGWGMTQFFLRDGSRCLPQHKRNGFSFTL